MSFGASECSVCGTSYRYVNGQAIAEVDDDESDSDELAEDEPKVVARPNVSPPSEGIDGSRTAGLLFVIGGCITLARLMNVAFAFDVATLRPWMVVSIAVPVVEALLGLGLIFFRRRLLTVALLFVALADLRTWMAQVWPLRQWMLEDDFRPYALSSLFYNWARSLETVAPTLLLVGMPGRGRYLAGILIFVLYQAGVVTLWRLFADLSY